MHAHLSQAVRWEYGQERGKPKEYAVRIEIQARDAQEEQA